MSDAINLAYLSARCEPLACLIGTHAFVKISDTEYDCMKEQLIAESWGLA